jgi:CubicO group peptidase (beta-lactamase class C family)
MRHKLRFLLPLVLLIVGTIRSPLAAGSLPRATPESQGLSSGAVSDLVDTLDRQIEGMHSLMVLRHGHVIAEGWWTPYDASHNHVLYSLSKSFTSTAVGFAAAEGKLSIDDEVLKFFPDEGPENPSQNLKSMRVRDILYMSAGHEEQAPVAADKISAKSFLAQPVPHKPGTHFLYNTPATFMQSAIVQKVTGQTVLDYLRPRLFEPLGIEHPVWDTNYQGISLGGYGLRVRTEDIARFGQFYLQKGKWNGKQLLPAEWIGLATSRQVSNGSNPASDWDQGYGFQFWRCRHNAYRGDGAFGQYCVVVPDQAVVVAITSGVKDMQAVLNILWDKLLPACGKGALPPNAETAKQLREKLGKLELPTAPGAGSSPVAAKMMNRTFVFPANDQKLEALSLRMAESGDGIVLVRKIDGKEDRLPCGYREWKKGRGVLSAGSLARFDAEHIAGSYAWSEENTCVIRLCGYETPFTTTLTVKFEGNDLVLDSESNVAFGPTKRPQLTGRAE